MNSIKTTLVCLLFIAKVASYVLLFINKCHLHVYSALCGFMTCSVKHLDSYVVGKRLLLVFKCRFYWHNTRFSNSLHCCTILWPHTNLLTGKTNLFFHILNKKKHTAKEVLRSFEFMLMIQYTV